MADILKSQVGGESQAVPIPGEEISPVVVYDGDMIYERASLG